MSKKRRKEPIPDGSLLKTGATVVDLAVTGRRNGGLVKGQYFWVAGLSGAGKTWISLSSLAEASINPEFDNYKFIYDGNEDGALMDIQKYFGPRMYDRLEGPVSEDLQEHSETIEEFYYNLDDACDTAKADGVPFIYVLDSMDGLTSKYSRSKFQEAKNADKKGTKAKGDYGDGKAKMNSERIKEYPKRLGQTGSILVIISQLRDNIEGGMFDEQYVAAGGHALMFYAAAQLWFTKGSKIKKTIRGKELVVGNHCRCRIKKNRITGRDRTVEFPMYYESGIDDIGSMVDFLSAWKYWPKNKGGTVDATTDFDDIRMAREDLVHWIEDNDLREDLEEITQEAWQDIERQLASKVKRKNKYE